ncbi:MAG: glycosyltransferase family 39 protein [Methylobacillus sp.]|jgi:4-amino-4-deoxy-L-arabinose transferase-like glycosyltransferase|nr:glycosyltransferase family 39 protein [Methylobacillus sp.]
MTTQPPRLLLWLTLLLGIVCFFWGLGAIPLLSYNEARRAIPTQVMFASGDWLLPQLNGELYIAKPPLLYWLTTTTSHLFGQVNEWSVRLPSALAALATVFAAYRYALRRIGPWAALFTAQVMIANATFALFARRAEIEMLLTALCFGALLAALHYIQEHAGRRWLLLSYFLLGLAVLAKGPLALLFVTLPLIAYALIQRETRAWQALRDPAGWAILLLVGGSWFLAVSMQLGFDIWQATLQRDIVNKVSGSDAKPFYNYFLWLLADFFPASLLLFIAPFATWKRWKIDRKIIAPLVAILVPLLIFTAFSNKHAKYLLPAYPLVALVFGKRLGELMESARPAWRNVLVTLGLLMPLGYAGFYTFAEARVFNYRYTALPPFTQWADSTRTSPLYAYEHIDERAIYYANRAIPELDKAGLEKIRASTPDFLLLIEHKKSDAVTQQADCKVREFKPWLDRRTTLTVLGFGNACASASVD